MRSTAVDRLSEEQRGRLHDLLNRPGVTHRQVADEVSAMGAPISKSSVSRYSLRMSEIAESDRQATMVADRYLASIGEEGKQSLSQATLHLVRAMCFDVSMTVRQLTSDDPDSLDQMVQMVGRLSRSLRDLEAASKVSDDRRRALQDELAAVAREVETTARREGLSDETARWIGERILGIDAA